MLRKCVKRVAWFVLGLAGGVAAAVVLSGCSAGAGFVEGLGVDIRAVGAAAAAAGDGGR